MGTQGVVSVVQAGRTVIKCVAGCDGYNAERLAQVIAEQRLTTIDPIYDLALTLGFGCLDCLVVQDKDYLRTAHPEDVLGGTFYIQKFADPAFNPRWAQGSASYTFWVDTETWEVQNCHIQRGKEDE